MVGRNASVRVPVSGKGSNGLAAVVRSGVPFRSVPFRNVLMYHAVYHNGHGVFGKRRFLTDFADGKMACFP